MWRQVDDIGFEHCNLRYREQEWCLNGIVLTIFDNQPALVEYQVSCDEGWRTHTVQVKMQLGSREYILELSRDEQKGWQINGQDDNNFGRCIDVDLGITPATNTLPIRRLKLAIGETAEIFAAWVRFPELSVEVLAQRYTRLNEQRYKYESREGTFVAEIEVDNQGFVISYPDYWERIGTCS
ncbi:MAG: hypothetical protein D6694_12135 [Gammaproteobacteria bacterium]|nr:MAG: hypothetical protein D6694_12135 [Gammaproteobacteria bacterium]